MKANHIHYLHWEPQGVSRKDPIILLHGLFASSRIWTVTGKEFARNGHPVFAPDLRNHGDSFHSDEHSVELMALDIFSWMKRHNIEKPVFVGHSMGGLVAAQMALESSENVKAIVVADIAPRTYPPGHEKEFQALKMNLLPYKTRGEIDTEMAKIQPSKDIRQFLQTNLINRDGKFYWKLNVEVLEKSRYLSQFTAKGTFSGPSLFIRGSNSNYVSEEDWSLIKQHFPAAKIMTIDGADHWLHHTHREIFIAEINRFCDKI